METFEGIYENGVVRFPAPIALPEHTPVTVVAQAANQPPLGCNSDRLYEIMSQSYETGEPDLAVRHNEHQP